jgi:hypothetical protein
VPNGGCNYSIIVAVVLLTIYMKTGIATYCILYLQRM